MTCATSEIVLAAQLATPIAVALIGGYFAYQQATTAKRKLRFDLFDKRFAIFEAARTFLISVMSKGNVDLEAFQQYAARTIDAEFLLNEDTAQYLEKIRKSAAKAMGFKGSWEGTSGEDRKVLVAKFHEEFRWLVDQLEVLPVKFRPFLRLNG